jgi:flavin reductase (DIM6/NTAB) family NADH-FMN oxidoreductase RutF
MKLYKMGLYSVCLHDTVRVSGKSVFPRSQRENGSPRWLETVSVHAQKIGAESMNRPTIQEPNRPETRFRTIEPKILYFGTPVALVRSPCEDGTTDLAPISSFWALGWTLVLGLLTETKTADNVRRHPECVVNLPSPEMWQNVEKLAALTGKNPVPELKAKQSHSEPDKFKAAELSPLASQVVKPMRANECPVHMEARVTKVHQLSGKRLDQLGGGVAAEVEVLRVQVAGDFIIKENYIDPAKWSPLIYNFRHYFKLADRELGKTFRAEQ